jgi:uncharacterized protein YqeY
MIDIDLMIREAMRAKQVTILSVLRGIKTATATILSAKGRNGKPLTEDEQISILRKQVAQRDEAIGMYAAAGRGDAADAEEREKAILEALLPQPLSDAEVAVIVDQALQDTGATTKKEMGKAIARAKELASGRVSPAVLSQLISIKLS